MSKKQYRLTLAMALIAGLVGGVVTSWFLIGIPVLAQKLLEHPQIIRAESFQVVDKNGKIRAVLGMGSNGEPSLSLADENEHVRTVVGLSALGIAHANGESSISLNLWPDGNPSLTLNDQEGKLRAVLGVYMVVGKNTELREQRPISSLMLLGKDEKVLWKAP
jgi:hypothetical protein